MTRVSKLPWLVIAAALGGTPPTAGAADDLGRLFTTPSERAQLDEARRSAPVELTPVVETRNRSTTEQAVDTASTLTLRGVVKRSGGRSTAWVNDVNTYQGDVGATHQQVEHAAIAGEVVTVKLPDGHSTVKMKVGQTLDPRRAEIRDLGTEPESNTAFPTPTPPEEADGE